MIENMITELTMLGTGNATVTKCYNTCFTIKIGKNILLVDAGGGNGILRQLEKAGIAISEIHDMFVTHAHTDHILGAVWMVRIVMQKMLSGQYTGTFRVYGHDKVLEVLDWICRKLLPAKIVALIGSGFYAKPFACMRIGKFSSLIRSTTVRHWTPGDWLRNWE